MPNREIPPMTPEQDDRLRRALRQADALNNAITVILDNPTPNPQVQEEMLAELQSLSESAQSRVNMLKREYGFKGY